MKFMIRDPYTDHSKCCALGRGFNKQDTHIHNFSGVRESFRGQIRYSLPDGNNLNYGFYVNVKCLIPLYNYYSYVA